MVLRDWTATAQCSGVVVVHDDGRFACTDQACCVANSEDPWEIVRNHGFFVPCHDGPQPCNGCGRRAAA